MHLMTRPLWALSSLLIPLALSACGQGTTPNDVAGLHETPVEQVSQAIVNGTRAPMVVDLSEGQILSLGWLHPPGNPTSPFCTGTIIGAHVVATASHCTSGRRQGTIAFGVRPSDIFSFTVTQVYEHPDVDMALLVLEEDATEAVEGLIPIAYNKEAPTNDWKGGMVEAAGYGDTRSNERGLFFAGVEFEDFNSDSVIVNGNGIRGLCFGDSGGPVMRTNDDGEIVTLGVESWGDPSCVGRDNLTRLDKLQEFIDPVLAGEAPPEGLGGCGDVSYQGECDGTTARWCQNGRLRTLDCAEQDTTCGFVSDDVGFYCQSNCGDVTYEGFCEGQTLVWCRRNRLRRRDCEDRGMVCAYEDPDTGYNCITPGPSTQPGVDDCDISTFVPECDGGVLRVCIDGKVEHNDCGDADLICVQQAGGGAGSCVPPCDDDTDFDSDPANCGSCGQLCADGQSCEEGECVGEPDDGSGGDGPDGGMPDGGDGKKSKVSGCAQGAGDGASAGALTMLLALVLRRRRR